MGDRGKADERDEFARAMRDVEPLGPARRREAKRHRGRGDDGGGRVPSFELTRIAGRMEGRRTDVGEEWLAKLRQGVIEPGNRLDLHGMTEEVARQEVYRFLRQSRASGLRSVALVHGRGLRSPGGPVLKRRLPAWLTQLPLARDVLAFAAAPRERGGDGVTLVLLARR